MNQRCKNTVVQALVARACSAIPQGGGPIVVGFTNLLGPFPLHLPTARKLSVQICEDLAQEAEARLAKTDLSANITFRQEGRMFKITPT